MKFSVLFHYSLFPSFKTDKIQYVQTNITIQRYPMLQYKNLCENMRGRKMQVKMYISLDVKMY